MSAAVQSILSTDTSIVPMSTHKFGGAALADVASYQQTLAVIDSLPAHGRIIVVSAMAGVTDALIAISVQARARDQHWKQALTGLFITHRQTAEQLGVNGSALEKLEILFRDCERAIEQLGVIPATDKTAVAALRAEIHGCGELFSSWILAACLGEGWAWLDARDVLVVSHGELGAIVDWPQTRERFARWRATHPEQNVVVTGFVARDVDDDITTLGRNGTDYSAAIFAVLFGAKELTIWKNVDGMMSADPRLEPEAVVLDELSYAEAFELAYFGAKVIHPQTLTPALHENIAIRIRNVFNPTHIGTKIVPEAAPTESPVKGLSLVRELAVLDVQGAGMIGVPGTAERLFAALHRAGVSVVMITQGSSEHSICTLVRNEQRDSAVRAVEQEFASEIAAELIQGVRSSDSVCVLAAVGDGMVGAAGVAARLTGALAQADVNIRAIAQGASERNISVAIAQADAARALRAAHTAFWLSPQTISVGIIGPGNVGRTLIEQLLHARHKLRREKKIDLRIRAIANSRHMQFWDDALGQMDEINLSSAPALDWEQFTRHVQTEHLPHRIIVDCSAHDEIAQRYEQWLHAGIHIVTPNKQAGSGDIGRYRRIQEIAKHGSRFRYEGTVGAGLPIIQTLRSLIDAGDEPERIAGMFSGTLAWLFNQYDGSKPFSELVLQAQALGFTEPDPREDLNGKDVARKTVILAREAGWECSMADVQTEDLVPPALRDLDRDSFFARISELDAPMAQRYASARANGKHLRYLAELDRHGTARVGLAELPSDHACVNTRSTDNIVQFTTGWYSDNPLIVQGPGAGAKVTAGGVFADILHIASHLGARL